MPDYRLTFQAFTSGHRDFLMVELRERGKKQVVATLIPEVRLADAPYVFLGTVARLHEYHMTGAS